MSKKEPAEHTYDPDDMGDMFREWNKEKQAKRANNRESSPELLTEAGIAYISKSEGTHLIIQSKHGAINFWPGTGLWMVVNQQWQRRGVHSLLRYLKSL